MDKIIAMVPKRIARPVKDWVKQKINNISSENQARLNSRGGLQADLYFPYQGNADSYYIPLKQEIHEYCEQGLPVPPKSLWLGYGDVREVYLGGGKSQVEVMLDLVGKSGFTLRDGNRVLDFGCGAGRMLRWLKPFAEKCEIWGTDISSEHIYWANGSLNPPFNFMTNTVVPHLPFGDSYFDFIYAGSVFTHIDDLAVAWLLEMRRLLKKEGRLYLTLHDRHSISELESNPLWSGQMLRKLLSNDPVIVLHKNDFGKISSGRGSVSQVFYDMEYFRKTVRSFFEIISVNEEAYGYQTGVVLGCR